MPEARCGARTTKADSRRPRMTKPFFPAAERNKGPILEALRAYLCVPARVLEVGAGSGQHAVHFAAALPGVVWQCSDLPECLPGIRAWVEESALANLLPPVVLDVAQEAAAWPGGSWDAIYSANMLHFMPWEAVPVFMSGCTRALCDQGLLVVYGPFNEEGRYTSEGNRRLDAWLAAENPAYAIRDREAVCALAAAAGLRLLEDRAMPANNRLLVWRKAGAAAAVLADDAEEE